MFKNLDKNDSIEWTDEQNTLFFDIMVMCAMIFDSAVQQFNIQHNFAHISSSPHLTPPLIPQTRLGLLIFKIPREDKTINIVFF